MLHSVSGLVKAEEKFVVLNKNEQLNHFTRLFKASQSVT